jgi:hypothetical protein
MLMKYDMIQMHMHLMLSSILTFVLPSPHIRYGHPSYAINQNNNNSKFQEQAYVSMENIPNQLDHETKGHVPLPNRF